MSLQFSVYGSECIGFIFWELSTPITRPSLKQTFYHRPENRHEAKKLEVLPLATEAREFKSFGLRM